MQLPPLPLANFSIHSLEQRFGRAFGLAFGFFFLALENGELLSGQQSTGSAVGRNARDVLGTSLLKADSHNASVSGVLSGCFGIRENLIFRLFTFCPTFWRELSTTASQFFTGNLLTDIPSSPLTLLLAKEQVSHRRFIAWPGMKSFLPKGIVGDTPGAS